MNKADIDEMIKWFATYISKPLKFGARHKIKNTGMILKYNIEISHPDAKGYHDVEEYYNGKLNLMGCEKE